MSRERELWRRLSEGSKVVTQDRSSQEIYNQLMEINEEAFGHGFYEVAYHALAAALHCALEFEAQGGLTALEQRAIEQKDWIDTHASEHSVSSQSASLHGNASVYTSLAKQIRTRQLMQRRDPPHR